MPTTIRFSGQHRDQINVSEDVEAVMEAWTSAGGLPFAVTEDGRDRKIYVNPQQVAYWLDSQA